MSIAKPLNKLVFCVILDLDGTLANTDGIVRDVLNVFLVKYGKQWDVREVHKIIGKTPFEAVAAAVVKDYGLPCETDEFMAEITPTFSNQLCNIKALPGANRLIKHLSGHGVPMAVASNSPRVGIESKISYHQDVDLHSSCMRLYGLIFTFIGWKESFSVIIGGDEVQMGKPSPEIFLEAAKRLNVEPSSCLPIEDSVPGVMGGKAAEMEVVVVPSLLNATHLYTSADEMINSLLDLRPEKWGLPPFQDWVEGTLPIEPWYMGGPVIKGFGRGLKVLGIPTANLSTEGYTALLSEHLSGVDYQLEVFKMVMTIGCWNPYFNNTGKTVEPWLLHEFGDDFYAAELRLVIVGYIEAEANFPSFESLIVQKEPFILIYSNYREDPYLK
ncbi:LOW QUALITY PROTEIN: Flavokinase domain-containing protein/HAD_2 domain-containing protein, partial [Cephalotus follicularis]